MQGIVPEEPALHLQPNKRLKLAAPALKGIVVFVIIPAARRSLSAIR